MTAIDETASKYPVSPQHPPLHVRVRLAWNGRMMEAARVRHPKSKKVVWAMRRQDGSDRYLPPKHAQKGPGAWEPEPEWWQPLHPGKWDAPLPQPLPPLPAWRQHDGQERMTYNVRGRLRRPKKRTVERDAIPADDHPWWWDATAINYVAPVTRDMAEGRLMRALAVSGTAMAAGSHILKAPVADFFNDLAKAAAEAESEARIVVPKREKLAITPSDRSDWATAMAWFAELNPPSLPVGRVRPPRFVALHQARHETRGGLSRDAKWNLDAIDRPGAAVRWLSDEQSILVWRAHQRSFGTIAELIGERHEKTVWRWHERALERIHEIANAPAEDLVLPRHIELLQERNRAFKRGGAQL